MLIKAPKAGKPIGQRQHFVPQFLQRYWSGGMGASPGSVTVVRRAFQDQRLQLSSIQIRENFQGRGLWSFTDSVQNRELAETKTLSIIDNEAARLWPNLMAGKSLSEREVGFLAAFLASIYLRQPEIVEVARRKSESHMQQLEKDQDVVKAWSSIQSPRPLRSYMNIQGMHVADYALYRWLQVCTDDDVVEDLLESSISILSGPGHRQFPLSDRPLSKVTIRGRARITLFPLCPTKLMVIYRNLSKDPWMPFPPAYMIRQDYMRAAYRNAMRSVIVSHPSALSGALENFWPKELFAVDYGPGSGRRGDEYEFGESYALKSAY